MDTAPAILTFSGEYYNNAIVYSPRMEILYIIKESAPILLEAPRVEVWRSTAEEEGVRTLTAEFQFERSIITGEPTVTHLNNKRAITAIYPKKRGPYPSRLMAMNREWWRWTTNDAPELFNAAGHSVARFKYGSSMASEETPPVLEVEWIVMQNIEDIILGWVVAMRDAQKRRKKPMAN